MPPEMVVSPVTVRVWPAAPSAWAAVPSPTTIAWPAGFVLAMVTPSSVRSACTWKSGLSAGAVRVWPPPTRVTGLSSTMGAPTPLASTSPASVTVPPSAGSAAKSACRTSNGVTAAKSEVPFPAIAANCLAVRAWAYPFAETML